MIMRSFTLKPLAAARRRRRRSPRPRSRYCGISPANGVAFEKTETHLVKLIRHI
jgi:hypothetical protein